MGNQSNRSSIENSPPKKKHTHTPTPSRVVIKSYSIHQCLLLLPQFQILNAITNFFFTQFTPKGDMLYFTCIFYYTTPNNNNFQKIPRIQILTISLNEKKNTNTQTTHHRKITPKIAYGYKKERQYL